MCSVFFLSLRLKRFIRRWRRLHPLASDGKPPPSPPVIPSLGLETTEAVHIASADVDVEVAGTDTDGPVSDDRGVTSASFTPESQTATSAGAAAPALADMSTTMVDDPGTSASAVPSVPPAGQEAAATEPPNDVRDLKPGSPIGGPRTATPPRPGSGGHVPARGARASLEGGGPEAKSTPRAQSPPRPGDVRPPQPALSRKAASMPVPSAATDMPLSKPAVGPGSHPSMPAAPAAAPAAAHRSQASSRAQPAGPAVAQGLGRAGSLFSPWEGSELTVDKDGPARAPSYPQTQAEDPSRPGSGAARSRGGSQAASPGQGTRTSATGNPPAPQTRPDLAASSHHMETRTADGPEARGGGSTVRLPIDLVAHSVPFPSIRAWFRSTEWIDRPGQVAGRQCGSRAARRPPPRLPDGSSQAAHEPGGRDERTPGDRLGQRCEVFLVLVGGSAGAKSLGAPQGPAAPARPAGTVGGGS